MPNERIEQIKIGTKSIEIISTLFSGGSQIYIMSKKQKNTFVKALVEQETLDGKIIYDDQLKLGDH